MFLRAMALLVVVLACGVLLYSRDRQTKCQRWQAQVVEAALQSTASAAPSFNQLEESAQRKEASRPAGCPNPSDSDRFVK